MKTTTKTAAFALFSLFFSATALAQHPGAAAPPLPPGARSAPAPARRPRPQRRPRRRRRPLMSRRRPLDRRRRPPKCRSPSGSPRSNRRSTASTSRCRPRTPRWARCPSSSSAVTSRAATMSTTTRSPASSPTGRVTNFDRFLVRRGRLKATYIGRQRPSTCCRLTRPATASCSRTAEATFVDTWTPLGLRFTMGQFKVPFGYEVLQSSADREMPERARVIRALFPGERDRGVRLTGSYEWFKLHGRARQRQLHAGRCRLRHLRDNNRYFDTYLRVGADFDFLVVGLSGQFGEKLGTTVGNTALTITDTNMDGIIGPTRSLRPHVRCGDSASGGSAPTRSSTSTSRTSAGWRSRASSSCRRTTNQDFRGVPSPTRAATQGARLDPDRQPEHRRLLRRRGAPRSVESQPRRLGAMLRETAHEAAAIDRQDHHPRHRPAAASSRRNLKASRSTHLATKITLGARASNVEGQRHLHPATSGAVLNSDQRSPVENADTQEKRT